MIGRVLELFVLTVGGLLLLGLLLGVVYGAAAVRCAALGSASERPTKMSVYGCMVQAQEGWVPEANWRDR